jgi:hypothetical protein
LDHDRLSEETPTFGCHGHHLPAAHALTQGWAGVAVGTKI